jgi:hypothetical protein
MYTRLTPEDASGLVSDSFSLRPPPGEGGGFFRACQYRAARKVCFAAWEVDGGARRHHPTTTESLRMGGLKGETLRANKPPAGQSRSEARACSGLFAPTRSESLRTGACGKRRLSGCGGITQCRCHVAVKLAPRPIYRKIGERPTARIEYRNVAFARLFAWDLVRLFAWDLVRRVIYISARQHHSRERWRIGRVDIMIPPSDVYILADVRSRFNGFSRIISMFYAGGAVAIRSRRYGGGIRPGAVVRMRRGGAGRNRVWNWRSGGGRHARGPVRRSGRARRRIPLPRY